MTPPQIGALVVIAWSDGIPARDLAAWQQVTPATISRLVAELETKGLIVRKNDDKDRRVQWIRATPEGAALVRREHGRRLAPLAAAIAVLPAGKRKDVERAVRMLETLTEASIAQQDSP